ncbi:MAG: hypothetical protein IGS48_18100 [Oscillatoriales cyanobacterium C42_A2020_001]|nr:hypothetical protein [Leptolyngbyaceae cyanobacterium C42_A2020_001]
MERGLLWLPLLVFFMWLAWTGWREYQKVEAYQQWAEAFDRAKYDIYSVLGQKDDSLTWGIPTRQGPINLETVSLQGVQSVQLFVNGKPIALDNPPSKGRAELQLTLSDRSTPIRIPFTEPSLASRWGEHLQKEILRLERG